MKFSVFTVMTPDLTPEELIPKLKAYGYDGVEWRCKETSSELQKEQPSFWGNNLCTIDPNDSKEQREGLQKMTERHGVETLSINPYLTIGDLQGTEQMMKIAKEMGASHIRLAFPSYDRSVSYNVLFEGMIEYLKEVQELARAYGVKGLVETHHKTIIPSVGLTYRAVESCDPNHIGVIFDPGNMVHEGFENYRMGMELLGPYLAHIHIKNGIWQKEKTIEDGTELWEPSWSPVHAGIVDWRQFIADLQAVGYDGYLGFEDFSGTYLTDEALQRNIEYMRHLVEAVS
ncbi:sugar phosphate isomerase/epimerase family protein [Shouchella shacheensis]|uniref:sugar phosphate isomerase/epimerase family protein n=1 Tax=Shouchella shacheensis TaxID=1649580 RepID=UPI0007404C82|nr:sugar phosphate isomerase/epimerase family protein [Shouchella shacheensis]